MSRDDAVVTTVPERLHEKVIKLDSEVKNHGMRSHDSDVRIVWLSGTVVRAIAPVC